MEAICTTSEHAIRRSNVLSRLGQAAQQLARRGYSVFPVMANKVPYIRGWSERATTDLGAIRSWWSEWPQASIGIKTDGLFVVDVDGDHGRESLTRLMEHLGMTMPDGVPTARTGRGMHLYFCADPSAAMVRSKARAFGESYPGIDIRAERGFVIAPPSRHASGTRYAWQDGASLMDLDPPRVPEDLRGALVGCGSRPERIRVDEDSRPSKLPNAGVVKSMLKFIHGAGLYDSWLRVGMALHEDYQGSEEGLSLWDTWSQGSPGNPVESYDEAALRATWDSFGRSLRRTTMRSLVSEARRNGWRGSASCLWAVPHFEQSKPTLPLAHPGAGIVGLAEIARDGLARFTGSASSVAFSGPPGMSKTTQAAAVIKDLLQSGKATTVIWAHKTRDRVSEVKRKQLCDWTDYSGLSVTTLLGRGTDPDGQFYCSRAASERGQFLAALGYSSCRVDARHATECGYLAQREMFRSALRESQPLLIVTTIDCLAFVEADLDQSGRGNSVVFLDDPGPDFGLFREQRFSLDSLREYEGHVARWVEANPMHVDATLAQAVLAVLDAAQSHDGNHGRLHGVLEALPAPVRSAVLARSRSGALAFDPQSGRGLDSGGRLRPRFGQRLLNLARLALRGMVAAVKSDGGTLVFAEPNSFLIESTKEGRVCFLSVGEMPNSIVARLGVRKEIATWEISNRVVAVAPLDGRNKWHGEPASSDQDNEADILFRALMERVAAVKPALAVIGTKKDAQALRHLETGGAAIGYYGRDHAGTDRFEGRGLLALRRWRSPPPEVYWHAAAFRGCLGILSQPASPLVLEAREIVVDHWVAVKVPEDRLEREVYRTFEAQFMLNGFGRCRPLTYPGSDVFIFDEAPVEGARVSTVIDIREFARLMGVDIEDVLLPLEKAKRGKRGLEREEAIRIVLARNDHLPSEELIERIRSDHPAIEATDRQLKESYRDVVREIDGRSIERNHGSQGLSRKEIDPACGGAGAEPPVDREQPDSAVDSKNMRERARGTCQISDALLQFLGKRGLPASVATRAGLSRSSVDGILRAVREARGPTAVNLNRRIKERQVLETAKQLMEEESSRVRPDGAQGEQLTGGAR